MTARECTQRALTAIDAGDFDVLREALDAREIALRSASRAELTDALHDGEVLALKLGEFRRTLAAEYARLGQMRQGLAGYSELSPSGCFDLRA